ncbi:right-handed parallel beta-helix repeat-containing protein [Haloferula sp.]|uniref:right-handed parallel beta-helix repeat-containing protein n=1 Tax=Haloferula sp. TaxID=2497595 RepID=UPI0032A05268
MSALRILILSALTLSSLQAQTIYVDDDAPMGGAGGSWLDAFSNLQEALAAAGLGSEIWVAEGTYYPDIGIGQIDDDVNSTFQLASGVQIYGGFPNGGTAVALGDRDPSANPTILSGDLDQDGTENGNAESVVTGSGTDATALLDGFTISYGNSSSGTLDPGGAGLRCEGSGTSPVIRDCRFTNHRSASNGIINIHSTDAPGPRLINCGISGNNARGLMGFDAIGSMENILIANNYNGFGTVGVRLDGASNMTFTNCTIANNDNLSSSSGASGGFFIRNTSTATLQNTLIWGNTTNISSFTTAKNNYHVSGSASGTFSHCVVEGWTAASLGGINNLNGTTPADDPLLADPTNGNFRLSVGSPAVNVGENAFSMESTDLDDNTRIIDGIINLGAYEGLVPLADGVEWLSYDIDAGNVFNSVVDLRTTFGDPGGTYSYVLSSNSNGALVTPSVQPDGTVSLTFSGTTRGIARLVFSADNSGLLGFYHLLVYRGDVIHVDASVAVAGSGTAWTDAVDDLQTALTSAVAGDQLWVAEGTYYPDTGSGQVADDSDSTFLLKNGVRFFGGFDSSTLPSMVDQRDWFSHPTVLSGDLQQDDSPLFPGSGNAYHVVTADSLDDSVTFDGFQIQSGYADGIDSYDRNGGGMQLLNSSIEVSNCLVAGCYAADDGGGIHIEGGTTDFTNLGLSGNRADGDGGGVALDSTSGNWINITVAGNFAMNRGGAFHRISPIASPRATLVNGLIWNNLTGDNTDVSFSDTTETFEDVRNSLVEGINFADISGFTGKGNINGDGSVVPTFLYSTDPKSAPQNPGDLRLDSRSTLGADLGDSSVNSQAFDLAHAARIAGAEIDMGAYEGLFSAPYPGQLTYNETFGTNQGTTIVDAFDLASVFTNPGGAVTYELFLNGDSSFVTGVSVNPATGQVDLTFSGTGSTSLVFRADNGQGPGYVTLVVTRLSILFVDESVASPGLGSSWATAFDNLQDALATASPGSQIWIAEGSYRPDQGTGITPGDRDASFIVPAGVSLVGGFEAGDLSFSDRNPSDHPVILSGDLFDDDDPVIGLASYDDNSFKVVDCQNTTDDPIDQANGILLDSLTISGGCGFLGAAILAADRRLEIVDCRISDNPITTQNGPFFSSLLITGGAIFISGTEISNNRLLVDPLSASPGDDLFGAPGIVILDGTLHCYDSTFIGNNATPPGHISLPEASAGLPGSPADSGYSTSGALLTFGDPSNLQTLTNCELRGNRGHLAGAIFGQGSIAVTNSLITGNRAIGVAGPEEAVGALAMQSPGFGVLLNTTITANRATYGGAILSSDEMEIVNCAILNNLAEDIDAGSLIFLPLTATNLTGEGSPYNISTSYVEGSSGSSEAEFPAFQSFVNPGYPIPAPHQDGDYRPLTGTNGEGTTGRLIDEGDASDYFSWLSQIESQLELEDFALPETLPDLAGNVRAQGGDIEIGPYEGGVEVAFENIYPDLLPDDDASGNGVTNFAQYAAGFEPGAGAIPGLEFEILETENFVYAFSHAQRANIDDLLSSIQVSSDLTTPFTTLGGVFIDNIYIRTSSGLIPFSSSVSLPGGVYVLGNDLLIEKSHNVGGMLPPRNFFILRSTQVTPGGA